MRTPTEHVHKDGTKTYKVKYRLSGAYTSQTFRTRKDALTFATILDGGGTTDALTWLNSRKTKTEAPTFGEFFTHTYLTQLTGITPRTRHDHTRETR